MRGRVVDHTGTAVAGADVLLLGSERITVYVDPGPRPGTIRHSISIPPNAEAPRAKTDGQGRFTLKRTASPADRIAVVSERMLLWEVPRKELAAATDLLITLPEPGELLIQNELPGKPAKLEYWLAGRPPHRVDWGSDSTFYRGVEIPNPGQRVVTSLPPGHYAVERLELTPSGIRSNTMHQLERRLLWVKPGQRTNSSYDHRTGQRVEVRVRGIENVKIRYGYVDIEYRGPEEQFQRGKLGHGITMFDVISLTEDGHFTTPPLPPNHYEFRLLAMRGDAPAASGQPYSIDASVKVDVPEIGAAPQMVEIVVKPKTGRRGELSANAADSRTPRLELHVRDEAASPVKNFEAAALQQAERITRSGDGDGRPRNPRRR